MTRFRFRIRTIVILIALVALACGGVRSMRDRIRSRSALIAAQKARSQQAARQARFRLLRLRVEQSQRAAQEPPVGPLGDFGPPPWRPYERLTPLSDPD